MKPNDMINRNMSIVMDAFIYPDYCKIVSEEDFNETFNGLLSNLSLTFLKTVFGW